MYKKTTFGKNNKKIFAKGGFL